ncbi:MAG: YdbL family protein [Nitrospinota bacterium]|nr:YdbL family protein [Nitrospinota bacterium]
MKLIPFLVQAALILLCSCANMVRVNIDVVDQRTALENQVLGSYADISQDLALLASVRSIDAEGRLKPAPRLSDAKREVIFAMQRQKFNQDDIEKLKAAGAAGENSHGYLSPMENRAMAQDPIFTPEFIKNLIDQENQDRKTIYQRILAISPGLAGGPGPTGGDMPKVERIMAGLNIDSSAPGCWIQDQAGKWSTKK